MAMKEHATGCMNGPRREGVGCRDAWPFLEKRDRCGSSTELMNELIQFIYLFISHQWFGRARCRTLLLLLSFF